MIEILCKKGVIKIFEQEYEEDIIEFILRYAKVAQDFDKDFKPRLNLFRKHFNKDDDLMYMKRMSKYIKNFQTQEEREEFMLKHPTSSRFIDRLCPMMVERGMAMVKKQPSLNK